MHCEPNLNPFWPGSYIFLVSSVIITFSKRENFQETSGTKNFQKVSKKVTMEVTNQEKVTPRQDSFHYGR